MTKQNSTTETPLAPKPVVSSCLNHFQFHGSTIYDERRKILEQARWDDYKIYSNDLCTDGSFEKQESKIPTTFFHEDKLYYFMTTHHGAIQSFFELNTDKEKCVRGQYGRYYEVV